MDFLAEAPKEKQITKQECGDYIRNVRKAGSKLPVISISELINFF